jgi:diguanylate cyclase (GGDEF)-like protein
MRTWRVRWGLLPVAAMVALIALVTLAGGFRALDDALADRRFFAETRPPTGDVVFVDLDSRSLEAVGVWPWPRHVEAALLDQLMALGADDVVFDIDFSLPSNETDDAAFERALKDAGGYAYLAAFQQRQLSDGRIAFNLPLQRFRQYAGVASVNVSLDADGIVRSYPYALQLDSETVPSTASILAEVNAPPGSGFRIDYSIDAEAIDRIPAADLLAGAVDAKRIAGKEVVIGASAVELRDFFVVPRQGVLPGALLQAVAVETLKQHRALQVVGPMPAAIAALILGLAALVVLAVLNMPLAIAAALAVSILAEIAASLAQSRLALVVQTAPIHAVALLLIASAVGAEVVRRGRQQAQATRERDAVRRILDQVIADNFDGVIIADAEGRIVAASKSAERYLGGVLEGMKAADLPEDFGRPLLKALESHADGALVEISMTREGARHVLEYVVTRSEVLVDKAPAPVVCLTFRDITDRRAAEDRLRYLGEHDILTGALARQPFVELIARAAANGANNTAVVLVDLRRFRIVNDTLGHNQGDLLLQQVVTRLRSIGPDAVARLGGDTFALLIPTIATEELAKFCDAVMKWLAFPYELAEGHKALIAASAGATSVEISGRDPDTLLSHADSALSEAKASLAGVAIFHHAIEERLKASRAMDIALRRAIADEQLTLNYQPQIDMVDGRMTGVEALLRFTHPELGPVMPSQFIPTAEETGLIVEIGKWTLEMACRDAMRWPQNMTVAVNVSPVQFELSDVAAEVASCLELTGLPASRLEIEITEGVFLKDANSASRILRQLQALGVSIALDDFGTGYSSLSYLSELPVDKIKIDQSFIKRLPADTQAASIIQTIIGLSRALGKGVLAEGIETADQAWMLKAMGCTMAQGFHFSRPVPRDEIEAKLAGMVPLTRAV